MINGENRWSKQLVETATSFRNQFANYLSVTRLADLWYYCA
jgi:hypothetical protein